MALLEHHLSWSLVSSMVLPPLPYAQQQGQLRMDLTWAEHTSQVLWPCASELKRAEVPVPS